MNDRFFGQADSVRGDVKKKNLYFWVVGAVGGGGGGGGGSRPDHNFRPKRYKFFLCFHSIQNLSKRENTQKKIYLGVPPPKKLVLLTTTGGGGEGSPFCGGHHPKVQVFF